MQGLHPGAMVLQHEAAFYSNMSREQHVGFRPMDHHEAILRKTRPSEALHLSILDVSSALGRGLQRKWSSFHIHEKKLDHISLYARQRRACFGMYPLLLTVLNRDYMGGYYNLRLGTVSMRGGTSQSMLQCSSCVLFC